MGEIQRGRRQGGLSGGTIATFFAALLASLGLGSVVRYFERRARRKAEERERRRAAEQAADTARLRATGHEPTSISVGAIVAILAGAVVGAVVIGLALWLLLSFLSSRAEQADVPLSPIATVGQAPPAPRLQVNQQVDWQQLRATDEAVLNSYGKSSDGSIRIPIDRAIDLTAQRGLPARSGAPQGGADVQAHELESSGGQPAGVTPAPLGQGSAAQMAATAQPTPTAAAGAARSAP